MKRRNVRICECGCGWGRGDVWMCGRRSGEHYKPKKEGQTGPWPSPRGTKKNEVNKCALSEIASTGRMGSGGGGKGWRDGGGNVFSRRKCPYERTRTPIKKRPRKEGRKEGRQKKPTRRRPAAAPRSGSGTAPTWSAPAAGTRCSARRARAPRLSQRTWTRTRRRRACPCRYYPQRLPAPSSRPTCG